jgi:GT2 family glycosyltransferase
MTSTDTRPTRRVTVPTGPSPEISIVVLAWRLGDELLDCLDALAAQRGAPSFEVVVVANGVVPAARAALDLVDGAVLVELDENVGFGGGCAAGASAATGSALVFVNDDAVAEPDWLAQLAARARADDRPAAVGSLLLDTDGTVQEAGSRVLSTAGTVQFGRGLSLDDARSAGLLVSREVDYCSAAALWVDRAAFDAIGGFDERFAPAYFEDVDLQWRLRLAGRPVVVEPDAVVRHESGASTDAMPFYREFLGLRNGATFRAKWADTLASAPAADAPLDELCQVQPPSELPESRGDGPSAAASAPGIPHAAVAGEYLGWLGEQLVQARDLAAVVDAQRLEAAELHEQFAELQARHHELSQSNHALFVHVQHLESMTTLDRVKARLPHRRD